MGWLLWADAEPLSCWLATFSVIVRFPCAPFACTAASFGLPFPALIRKCFLIALHSDICTQREKVYRMRCQRADLIEFDCAYKMAMKLHCSVS